MMNSSKLSQKYSNSLIINIKVSRILGAIFASGHIGAGVLMVLLPIPIWTQIVALCLLVYSLYHVLHRHVRRMHAHTVTGLEIDVDGGFSLRQQGDWTPGRYVESFQSGWLVIVRLKLDSRRRPVTVLLARDAVEPDAFRELRARLHFQVVPQESRL